jgi:hypothetical protein
VFCLSSSIRHILRSSKLGYPYRSGGGEGTGEVKKRPRAWLSGAFVFRLWRHDEKGSAGHKKPPAGHTPPEGASAHAPSGHLPTRRAYEHGGVSIAALLIARTTAIRIVLPRSPGASHSLLISIYVSQSRSCQEAPHAPVLRGRGRRCEQIPEGPDRLIGEADLTTAEEVDDRGERLLLVRRRFTHCLHHIAES